MRKFFSISLLFLMSTTAQSHIVLDVQSSPAGSYYRGALRVSHGCSSSPVTQVIATIPSGVQGAKPMPKPGWHIDIKRSPLAQPYVSHGRTVTEDVSEIRWTAKTSDDYLSNAYFDEFVIFAKLPDVAGKLYWKISQVCEKGRIDWHEVPTENSTTKLLSPAAVMEITPKKMEIEQHKH